jgi:hypothetical protein
MQEPTSWAELGDSSSEGQEESMGDADHALAWLDGWDSGQRPEVQQGGIQEWGKPFWPTEGDWIEELQGRTGGSLTWPVAPAGDSQQRMTQLQASLGDMCKPPEQMPESETHFEAMIDAQRQQEHTMRGGQWTRYADVWDLYAARFPGDADLEWACQVVRHGLHLEFTHPDEEAKSKEPLHAKKLAGVRRALLRAGRTANQVEHVMRGSVTPPCWLGNRIAGAKDLDFARDTVAQGLRTGVMMEWPQRWADQGLRPRCILPLAVATAASGKRRLILDVRVVNAFLRYTRFAYEKLSELVAGRQPWDWVSARDLAAGYHHVFMAPAFWGLLGFQLDGRIYVYVCLPFGLSQAPWAFTRLLKCVYQFPRSIGWRVTAMVDDSARVSHTLQEGLWRCWCTLRQEAALGTVHRGSKSTWFPTKRVKFLGFDVDTAEGRFWVPQDKLDRLHGLLQGLAEQYEEKAARTACGLLAAVAPALRLTPLLGAWLREAERAESATHTEEDLRRLLVFFKQNLSRLNGVQWYQDIRPATTLKLVADASESGVGALVRGTGWRAAMPFPDDVAKAGWSSTKREVYGAHKALQELLRTAPELVTSSHLQICGDNQAAIWDCQRMRGTTGVFTEVRKLYELACEHDLTLSFVWYPRENEHLRVADQLSKRVDEGDWCLSAKFAREQLFHRWGWPDIDCLASASARQPDCEWYFAACWDGRCAAVDGWAQHWGMWPESSVRSRAGKPLCFVFPPVPKVGEALTKIAGDKTEAILVCPRSLRPGLQSLLDMVPIVGQVDLCGPHKSMIRPTRAVPLASSAGGWKVPMQAVRISWTREPQKRGTGRP